MVSFQLEAPLHSEPATIQAAEAMLVRASSAGQLLHANVYDGYGWSLETLAQLSVLELKNPPRELVAEIVAAGVLRRLGLVDAEWGDVAILAPLREVVLTCCSAVEDLSPLAGVPKLVVRRCEGVVALPPAMRNGWLEVEGACRDLSGLASGRVRHLGLQDLWIEDVSVIAAMEPPPHTVILVKMHRLRDVSALTDIPRLKAVECPVTWPRSLLKRSEEDEEEEEETLEGLGMFD